MNTSSASGSQSAPATHSTVQSGGMRVRTHLVLLVVAVLMPMIIFSAAIVFRDLQQDRRNNHQQLENMAQEAAERVDSQLRRTVAGLQALAQADALTNQDLRAFHSLASRLAKAQNWEHVALFGSGGEQLVNTRLPFGAALPPMRHPELAIDVVTSRQPLVSNVMHGTLSDAPITVILVPVLQRQSVRYVIAVGVAPVRWERLIDDQIGGADGMQTLLLDARSSVIAKSYHGDLEFATDRIKRVSFDATEGGRTSGPLEIDAVDGQRAYAASYKVGMSGWSVVAFAPTELFDLPSRRTAIVMGTGFALLLLVALGLALLLGRRTANSISQLVASVRAVAAGGAPLPTSSHVLEVFEASQALNETAALLAKRRCELEAADKAKNAFLALLGHELRNPLAPIRNAVQLMKQTAADGEAARWAVGVIDRQSAHLGRLVDDLLDVTRIDHGKIELRKQVLDVRQLLHSAVQDQRGVLEQAGVALTLDLPTAPLLVDCDRIRLAQIIGNVLHNATKFTPRDGRIAIRAALQGATVAIEVSDTGSGIAPENLDRIFELFAQERPSGVGGSTGLGIGLALTRRLLELHGGAISAASAGSGKGSTFRVELPAVVAPASEIASGPAASVTGQRGVRVLVVDDNKDCADSLQQVLAMSGYVSTVAYSGRAALLAIQHEQADAVLLDIGLPDINGYEVCRLVRRSNIATQPVLIALTGWGQESDRALAMAAGFDAHLTKPVSPDEVIAMLDGWRARGERNPSASDEPRRATQASEIASV